MIDYITLTGGVVADAELRFTNSGAAVCGFRIAQSDSKKNDAGEWETTQSLYLPVNIWDDNPQYRKNPVQWAQAAADLKKGDKVSVRGKLITRTWQAQDGSNRSQVEFAATEFYVMPDAGGYASTQYGQQSAPQQQQDPWGSQPQSTGSGHHVAPPGGGAPAGAPTEDEPPF